MFNNGTLINVNLGNNEIIQVKEGTVIMNILEKFENFFKEDILAVKVNNSVHSIYYSLVEDSTVEPITYYSIEGERIYTRSLKFFFLMAMHNLLGKTKVEFTNKINRDFFIKYSEPEIDKEELVEKINQEMNRIIASKLPVNKLKTSFEMAKKIYKKMNSSEQLENFKIKTRESYTFYECNGYYNYLYGLIVPNSSYIKGYELKSYCDGFVLSLPSKFDVTKVYTSTEEKIISSKENQKIYYEFIKFKHFTECINISKVSDINEHVLNCDIGNIIRLSEIDHNRRLVEVINKIINKGNVKLIFISGPSSSGKTTFSQKLALQLQIVGKRAIPLAMDNYFNDEEFIPLNPDGTKDYESIQNVDLELFSSNIKDLLEGNEVEIPEYNFSVSKKEFKGKKIKLSENDILIIEGIHALNPVVSNFISDSNVFKIYLAPLVTIGLDNYTKVSSNDTRLIRRIVRDYDSRGRLATDTLSSWRAVRKGEAENIFPFVSKADYIYNTSLVYELGVLKPFAENLLLRVDESSKYYSDARRLYKLLNNFRTIETTEVPLDSIVKEFVGKGCFYR